MIVCSFCETQTGNSKTINSLWSDGLIISKIALSSEEIELERAGGLEWWCGCCVISLSLLCSRTDCALTNTTTTYLYLPPPYIKCSFTRRTLPQAWLCINFTSKRFWKKQPGFIHCRKLYSSAGRGSVIYYRHNYNFAQPASCLLICQNETRFILNQFQMSRSTLELILLTKTDCYFIVFYELRLIEFQWGQLKLLVSICIYYFSE